MDLVLWLAHSAKAEVKPDGIVIVTASVIRNVADIVALVGNLKCNTLPVGLASNGSSHNQVSRQHSIACMLYS